MERVKGLQPTEFLDLGKIMIQFLVWFYGKWFIHTE